MVNEARYFNQKPGYFYAGHPIQNEEWFEPFAEGLMLSYSRKYDATGNSEFQLFFDFSELTADPKIPCIQFFDFSDLIEQYPPNLSCIFEQTIFGFVVNFSGFDRNQQIKIGKNIEKVRVAQDLFIEWTKKQSKSVRDQATKPERAQQKSEL